MTVPNNVCRFEWLMYGSLVPGLIYAPFNPLTHVAFSRWGYAVYLIGALALSLYVVIIWAIARRRLNWLRYLMLILFLVGWAVDGPEVFRMYAVNPIYETLVVLGVVMHGAAYYFIFTGDAAPWFRRSRASE